jgi:hypothetical protein
MQDRRPTGKRNIKHVVNIEGTNIDLTLTLNESIESEFLTSMPKQFHRSIVEGKKDCLNLTVLHKMELILSDEGRERSTLCPTLLSSTSTRYKGEIKCAL